MGKNTLSGRRRGQRGITLIETLIALLVLTAVTIGLAQFAGNALRYHLVISDRRQQTVEIWNRSREIRQAPPRNAEQMTPFPDARPLARCLLRDRYGRTWEVLRAEK